MEEQKLQLVDIDAIIKNKSEKLYKYLPRFVVRYIKHIVHQDEINDILTRAYQKYYGIDFADFIIRDFNVKINLIHQERIPLDNKLIIVSNHPLGGFDGTALISLLGNIRHNVKCPVNDILMYLSNFQSIFVPINKTGKNTIELAQNFDKLFSENDTILYFPAGLCSRKIKGQIVDLDWKKTFISKAKQYGHDILPIYFEGKNSNFFYNLSKLRTALHIKANIEQIFLPDEFFKQRNSEFNVIVSHVIKNEELLADSRSDFAIAQSIKQTIYQLPKELNAQR